MSECKAFGLIISIIFITLIFPNAFAHDLQSSDLSNYITPYDEEVIELAEFIGLKPFLSYTLENARSAYYWVSENIQYRFDDQTWGVQDYWQLPSTTIRLGTGDCEDQALLLASLLRALKLPRDNVRLVVGSTGRGTYHAWVEIKLPLPIYGLESIAARTLDILENKKVTVLIGEVSFDQHIGSKAIAEVKSAGLSHRDGWLPLDTTVKILGYPVPFSWWLTYGYNVYTLFDCRVTPQQTFQDKARIWEKSKEIGIGESLTFEIQCISGDRILGVAKVTNAWKEQMLNVPPRSGWYNVQFGPCSIGAGETLRFEWIADRSVSVYILNQADWDNWLGIGTPPSRRAEKIAETGLIEYTTKYSDNFYVVICHYQSFTVYNYAIKRKWQETTCNVQVTVSDSQGVTIFSDFITKREVEKSFNFTANRNGIYRVVLKNIGDSAPIYVRLEEYLASFSREIAGVSKSLALAEQEYVNKITKSIEQSSEGNFFELLWKPPLNIILPSMFIVIIAASVYILRKRKIGFSQK